MNKEISEVFNAAADKVVALKEMRQKSNAMHKQELSFAEKLYLNLFDKPWSVVVGGIVGVQDLVNGTKTEGGYISTSPFGIYVSGSYMKEQMAKAARYQPRPKFQDKINAISARAFEQSEDVSQKPVMQTLKPM